MTLARFRGSRGRTSSAQVETRSGMQSSWPMGYGWNDPAAIPPPGLFNMQRAGVLVTQHTLLQVDIVFTAMRLITTAILKMGDPMAFTWRYSKDNMRYKQYLDKQPSILTDSWGGRMMQYDGRRRTIMSLGLFQEAFWYVLDEDDSNDPNAFGLPSALEVLHPAFMEVKAYEDGPLKGQPKYIYGSGMDQTVLPPDRVIHIPLMAMPQARRSLSTVEYAGISGALAMAAYEFGSTWFSQGASPSFLLSTDQKLGQQEVERIAQKFTIEHAGLQSAHLPLVVDSGLKVEKISATPDEAQYLNTLEYSRSVLASWFGVDELIPNALERQTPRGPHSGAELMQRFNTLTLSGYTIPMCEGFAQCLPQAQHVDMDETLITQPDAQFLATLMMAARQSQAGSVNDIRTRYLHWPPVEGGDDVLAPLASNTDQSAMGDSTGNHGTGDGGA